MGTLTANTVRLPNYCDHKLPTSCRLSSIPECCACADERAHAASYSTYIDGIGLVQRGVRWQRYCWFCKEFWQNRVDASGLRPGQTRIPAVPVQTDFLERWYEFHRGYRVVKEEDGSEEKVPVLGEDLRDVSPGFLPRTLDELRAWRGRSAAEEQARQQQAAVEERTENEPTLEDTLDNLYQATSSEEAQQQRPSAPQPPHLDRRLTYRRRSNDRQANVHAQAMIPTGTRNREYQARRIAALRRELHRMRNGIERVISGLRDLGEDVPDHMEATGRLTALGNTLDEISGTPLGEHADQTLRSIVLRTNSAGSSQIDQALASIQARVDEAGQHLNEARQTRDQAASELDLAEQELRTTQQRLQQLQHEQRTTENYMRLFGTREEMLAAGENYESPIGGMFTRAWERFRAAEDVRREERTLRQVLNEEAIQGGEATAQRPVEMDSRERDVRGVLQSGANSAATRNHGTRDDVRLSEQETDWLRDGNDDAIEEYYDMLRRHGWSQQLPDEQEAERDDFGAQHSEQPRARSGSFAGNMLNAVVSARDREARSRRGELRERSTSSRRANRGVRASYETAPTITDGASPPSDQHVQTEDRTAVEHAREQNRRHDVNSVLIRMSRNPPLMRSLGWGRTDVESLQQRYIDRTATSEDLDHIDELLGQEDIIWATGIPSIRAMRNRLGHPEWPQTALTAARNSGVLERADAVEAMAEAFQTSAALRRKSGLAAPERLQMLYRLQAGERSVDDRDVLNRMLLDAEARSLAVDVHRQHSSSGESAAREQQVEAHIQEIQQERQWQARQGDHSRQELNEQRRATQAVAIAAGRMTMRNGPVSLFETFVNRDDETRAAYERLRQNGWLDASTTINPRNPARSAPRQPLDPNAFRAWVSSSSEGQDSDMEEGIGLDAKDSGRPEPKTDEDMTVKLECRICYSQVADVACLPCGHLVMCKWCSDLHSPTMAHDRTRPRRAAGCPVCRKGIRQKVKVFRA